jgi:hypothetical protein
MRGQADPRPLQSSAAVSPADVAEAGQVLTDFGYVAFYVDRRLLAQILAGHPELASGAASWGWSDTAVRGELADLVARALLHRPWPTFGTAAADPGFDDDLRGAHEAWVSHAGPDEAEGRAE